MPHLPAVKVPQEILVEIKEEVVVIPLLCSLEILVSTLLNKELKDSFPHAVALLV